MTWPVFHSMVGEGGLYVDINRKEQIGLAYNVFYTTRIYSRYKGLTLLAIL